MKINLLVLLALILSLALLSGCTKDSSETDNPVETYGDERAGGFSYASSTAINGVTYASPPFGGNLPSRIRLNFPPAAYQGREGSCASFACAYGVMSYFKGGNFRASDGSINTSQVFSPEYTYNQTVVGSDCYNSGSYFISDFGQLGILDLLVQQGVCTWATMPYTDDNGCSTQPSQSQRNEAAKHKLLGYRRVAPSSTQDIKAFLASGYPILIGADVDQAFNFADASFRWESSSGSTGAHAMVIIGYDDAEDAFRVLNSWGQSWGDQGETWLDYSFAGQIVREAYVAYPDTTTNDNNDDNDDDDDNVSNCSDGIGTVLLINESYGRTYVKFDKMPTTVPFFSIQTDTLTIYGVCAGLRTYYTYSTTVNMEDNDISSSNTFMVYEDSTIVLKVRR